MKEVSIILPSFNHAKFLKKRLDSILNQTFSNWELIIIDDCSNDDSKIVLDKFVADNSTKVAHYIINKKNSGTGYSSWEKGITLAEGKYIWIAESDDYCDKTFLEEQIGVLNKTNSSLAFCSSIYINEKDVILYSSSNRTKKLNVNKERYQEFISNIFIENMPFEPFIINGSSVVFKNCENFPSIIFKHKQMSDQFLWTSIIKNKSFVFLNKELNFFRRHNESTTYLNSIKVNSKIYKEYISYLNYFNLSNKKFKILIKHYIKHYVWKNKHQVFNSSIFNDLENVKNIKIEYFKSLISFFYNKIVSKYGL